MSEKERKRKKLLNKHFWGMTATFVIIIVSILTFLSLLHDINRQTSKERVHDYFYLWGNT